jgi:hypothetical protein
MRETGKEQRCASLWEEMVRDARTNSWHDSKEWKILGKLRQGVVEIFNIFLAVVSKD